MHLNITDSETGDNKGSSGALVHYLDKEARTEKDREPQQWFNAGGEAYPSYAVRNSLDKNITKLGKTDAKFYLVNISPSQKEITHLKELYGEEGAEGQLKAYAIKVMDEYALNFKRPGINSGKDLLWYGKLEQHRYYSFKDAEVKNGKAKRGDRKPGEQMHIQVIVSRKDMTNKIKLSPENTSRGKNVEHSRKMGQFDRVAFKNSGERVFDALFDFTRPITDTFGYANTRLNGTLAERLAMEGQKAGEDQQSSTKVNQKVPVLTVPDQSTGSQLKESASLLEMLLAKADFDPAAPVKRKKKRRKGQGSSQELSL